VSRARSELRINHDASDGALKAAKADETDDYTVGRVHAAPSVARSGAGFKPSRASWRRFVLDCFLLCLAAMRALLLGDPGVLRAGASQALPGDGSEAWLRKVAVDCGYRVPALARLLGISSRRLARAFKAQLRCTPGAWLRAARLEDARCLLRAAESVKMVAYSVGYRHESQFCRDFKAYFGYSPSADLDAARAVVSASARVPE
jgi:AraC-like DNA-binding protein